jgi:hypothetical protein
MAEEPKLGASRGNAGKGRRKGSINKMTAIAKDVIATAADRLGGVDRLVVWVGEDEKNEAAFWTSIYPKLLPLQVQGGGEQGQHILQVITGVPRGND